MGTVPLPYWKIYWALTKRIHLKRGFSFQVNQISLQKPQVCVLGVAGVSTASDRGNRSCKTKGICIPHHTCCFQEMRRDIFPCWCLLNNSVFLQRLEQASHVKQSTLSGVLVPSSFLVIAASPCLCLFKLSPLCQVCLFRWTLLGELSLSQLCPQST